MPRWSVSWPTRACSPIWILFILGVRQMVALLKDLDAGRPFRRDNARRLRIVGLPLSLAASSTSSTSAAFYALFKSTLVPAARPHG